MFGSGQRVVGLVTTIQEKIANTKSCVVGVGAAIMPTVFVQRIGAPILLAAGLARMVSDSLE